MRIEESPGRRLRSASVPELCAKHEGHSSLQIPKHLIRVLAGFRVLDIKRNRPAPEILKANGRGNWRNHETFEPAFS